MFISKAFAQDAQTAVPASASDAATATVLPPDAPSAMEAFLWNMGLVAVMVALFYVLLIQPQQKRFKEHSTMLQGLKKGDKVITGGGLIGVIDALKEGSDEAVIDLGGGMKVTALRSTLQLKADPILKPKPANDTKTVKSKS